MWSKTITQHGAVTSLFPAKFRTLCQSFFATPANGELRTVKHNLKFVVDFENAVRNVPIILPILRTTAPMRKQLSQQSKGVMNIWVWKIMDSIHGKIKNNELWTINNQQERIMNRWKKHPKNSEWPRSNFSASTSELVFSSESEC